MKVMSDERKAALPADRACPFPRRTVYRVRNLRALDVAATALIILTGCGGSGDGDAMERRLEAERARCDRLVASLKSDLARQEAERRGVETDYQGAVLIWGGTAAALFIAVLLLAREQRGRRVMDRFLRMILHRGDPPRHDSREP